MKVYFGVGDVHVAVGRHYEDHARLQRLVLGDGAHGQPAVTRKDLLQVALVGSGSS
jgi:hypothetical protein